MPSAKRKSEEMTLPAITPIRFWGVHAAAIIGGIWFGVTLEAIVIAVVLYWVRMFGVTAGYHRYFSHKSFQTSRGFAFCLAVLAQSSGQRGVIWWARNHRHHHRYSDREEDIHSPVKHGFWRSHIGWIFHPNAYKHLSHVKDLERHWELRMLDRYPMYPAIALGALCWLFAGWPGLFIGFFASTVALFHATFTINSLAHVWGTRRYETKDDSRNNPFLAFLTMGEGWHNNHHHFQHSCRQGFFWYEFDFTYWILKALSFTGLVWDLREPPLKIRKAA